MKFKQFKVKIDGVPCSLIQRGPANGEYLLTFRRDVSCLEQIETIHWERPHLSEPCELPAGYGFELERIDYHMGDKSFVVAVKVTNQYLGDVTGYQAQIAGLETDKAALEADKAALIADKAALSDQLAEADETAIALYEELTAMGDAPAEDDPGEAEQAEAPAEDELEEVDQTEVPAEDGHKDTMQTETLAEDENGEVAE